MKNKYNGYCNDLAKNIDPVTMIKVPVYSLNDFARTVDVKVSKRGNMLWVVSLILIGAYMTCKFVPYLINSF